MRWDVGYGRCACGCGCIGRAGAADSDYCRACREWGCDGAQYPCTFGVAIPTGDVTVEVLRCDVPTSHASGLCRGCRTAVAS